MKLQKNRIAIISPSQNAYSETFIQEQKNGLQGNIYYYFKGEVPQSLEGFGKLGNKRITYSVKIRRKLGLKTLSIAETAFMHSLKENKIQVVLAQYGTTANKIVNVCKQINVPLITHFHGYDASVGSVIKNCNYYKEVFYYSTYVIAVSISMKKKIIELGCPQEKVIYNACAPNDLFLNIVPKFSQSNFISLGRFVNKKAPYNTILAFKKVHDLYPEAKLIMGGEGELLEPCINIIKALKLEESVLLPGIIDRVQFMEYLSNGLAFVQHSVTAFNGDQEGTPVAVLEASAAGLPVISTKHAGISDVIIEGETGFLVEENDIETMAENMILLLENKVLAEKMGINGKERIKINFTMKKHLSVIDSLIEKIIKNTNE
ncbi:glycosyltransferase [Flavobacterium aquicola]|uniref:Glycosyltransferase involved in cell wall biosynthesis n=1 Tax=Flavobacterium aquicola TaxID=1682742 RepID=A0A3E0EM99_9FLAO|nr:glycosyltransferase [Flavobacterium aquicola]REG98266.1 glycosyltransferase involved in cell wall biosynthesis [Flavobacterium aquicola]